MPWEPLVAGMSAGLALSALIARFASAAEPQAELIMSVRLTFLPALAGLGFLLHDGHRQLAGALPVPSWRIPVLRLSLALPPAGVVCWLQLGLVTGALARSGAGRLPVPPLATEFAGCCAVVLAVAAAAERSRWQDLGGAVAVPAALALQAVLALPPLRLLPTAFAGLTHAQHTAWLRAWLAWAVLGLLAAALAAWFSRDPWHRHGL
ncbi:MAG TPA: hypothetical protein VGG25_00460 [Streptosporangiaceae bacterium]